MEPYRDSLEHLQEELGRLDLLLRRAIVIARATPDPKIPQELRGVVVTEEEVNSAFDAPDIVGARWRNQSRMATQLEPFDRKLNETRQSIDQRRQLSEKAGLDLALPRLARAFGLSSAEVDLLLVGLGPELEPRYETLYSYLQVDATRKRPSVDLAFNLICRTVGEKIFARRLLSSDAQLRRYRLIALLDDPQDRQPGFLRQFIKVDETVVRFLVGQPVNPVTTASEKNHLSSASPELDEATRQRVTNLVRALQSWKTRGRHVIQLVTDGPPAWDIADGICSELGMVGVRFELAEAASDAASASVAVRNAILNNGILVVAGGNVPNPTAEQVLWSALNGSRLNVILLGRASAFGSRPTDSQPWRIEIPPPGYASRQQAWADALAGGPAAGEAKRLADTFQFGPSVIRETSRLAASLAALRSPTDAEPTADDLMEAGRSITTPNLSRFAIPLSPRYGWSDLVLPPDKLRQLRDIETRIRCRQLVQREWGFGEKVSRGKGVNVLFTGASGTGKTMAAEVLAGSLALTLHQIDLSTVISKYIGETEQHLSQIFQEAESSQTLLFFDEAEALFGKRTEVKDAHDRYANIEVNYLLQRIEQYTGIVVLATNLHRNLDDAFLRRLSEVIEFPSPDEEARLRIWQNHFPGEAPTKEIDFEFLARQFKLSGGNIRNVALAAAYAAARDGTHIEMSHIIQAIETEYRKQGRLVMGTEFGDYLPESRRRAVR